MTFRNESVPIDELPALEQAPLTPVSPRFAPYRVLSVLVFWIPLALVVGLVPVGADVSMLLRGALGILVFAVGVGLATLAGVEARRRAFGLRQEDLIHVSGLLVRRTTVLPVCRIQHVETASGPLERLFGLMRLTCFTAGGTSADLVLAGLQPETAERVRQYLLQRIRQGDESASSSEPDAPL